MATHLAIDPALLDRAVQVSGERTKKPVVTEALEEFIARREQRRVAALLGADIVVTAGLVLQELLSTDQDFSFAANHCPLRIWSGNKNPH